jgi:VanZ family protein
LSSTPVRALAPLAWMGLIFYLSSRSSVGPDLPEFTRWIAHFCLYAMLAALWFFALAPALGGRRAIAAAAAISFLYAISDEIHQGHVPGRDSDPLDVLVDCFGIAFALWTVSRSSARRAASRRPPTSP